jgi:hypothetical protein
VRIRHIIPTVGPGISDDLDRAQPITFESIDRAIRVSDPRLDIDVCAVRFADEPIPCPYPWLRDLPVLEQSILDLGTFNPPRRLPLMRDVLGAFGPPDDFDLAVLTNADIAIQPLFYELIEDLVNRGHDAASITRRTVQPRFGQSSFAHFATTIGAPHPGHDCFIMTPSLIPSFVGNVALGVRYVARPILWHLMLNARNFETFSDLHATFHVGDDRQWTNPNLADYDRHNVGEAQRVVDYLTEQHGEAAVDRISGTAAFRKASRQGRKVELAPPVLPPVARSDTPPATNSTRRMIFSTNSGRSGSEFLSRLLDAAPTISAGHERAPTMTGPRLREVGYLGFEATLEARRQKVGAIRQEFEHLPTSTVYADTSHMFVKTFADVVFDAFEHHTISVIDLRRDPIAIARSFFALDYFGPNGGPWKDWMLPPTTPFAPFRLRADEVQSQFDLIFGYLVGIATRTRELRSLTPQANWIDVDLSDLSTMDGAQRLFEQLRVKPPGDLTSVLGEQVNVKATRKNTVNQDLPTELVAAHWRSFFERFGENPDVQHFARRNGLDDA